MAVNKKKKDRNIFLLISILLLFLLILGGIRVLLKQDIKIESRVETIKEYEKAHSDYTVAAWVKVPGTDIDYPVINDASNIAVSDANALDYLWKNGVLEKLNRINYIMGHNVLNLSKNPTIRNKDHTRFEQLMSFTYLDFAKDNEYIQLTIDGKDYLFKIFAVSYPKSDSLRVYNEDTFDDEDVENAIKSLKEISIYNYDVDVNKKDTILNLITCTRMFGFDRDFQVSARLVRDNESTTIYKVEKTKKYDVVEKAMKGGKTTNEEL